MPAKDSRSPAQIVSSIQKKSAEVRAAAAELAARIDQFVAHLGKTPGRVETYCYGPHPEGTDSRFPRELALHFHRDGDGWALEYGTYHEGYNDDPENPVDYKPLSEAPLKYKLAAMRMFPDMLHAMEEEQDRTVKRIQEASAEFDAFMATLKPDGRGGK